MKITEVVQSGNQEQCGENGIEGFEYSFGIRYDNNKSRFSYICKSQDNNTKYNWGLNPKYRTTFCLAFIY